MPRYSIRKPRSAWDGEEIDYEPEAPALMPDLCVDSVDASDTGLVDVRGNSIVRLPSPIGFQAEVD